MEDEAEIWRDVVGYEGYYQVSNLGRVYGVPRKGKPGGGFPKIYIRKQCGYPWVSLCTPHYGVKKKAVHVLVARAFLGPRPEGYDVSHEDGVKTNSRLSNLKYRSHRDNMLMMRVHGTDLRGEKIGKAVLTEAEVREIKGRTPVMFDRKLGYAAIANEFGVHKATIRAIFTDRTWAHVTPQ